MHYDSQRPKWLDTAVRFGMTRLRQTQAKVVHLSLLEVDTGLRADEKDDLPPDGITPATGELARCLPDAFARVVAAKEA